MINITDSNRDDILESYVSRLVENMDTNSALELLEELLLEKKDIMSNESLEDEIIEFDPDLLRS